MEKRAPMQKAGYRIAAIAAAMCVIVALAFYGMPAKAVEDSGGGNTLTVIAVDGSDLAKDIADGNVIVSVDVFKVASMSSDGTEMSLEPGFQGLQDRLDKARSADSVASDRERLAKAALEVSGNIAPVVSGQKLIGGVDASSGKQTARAEINLSDDALYLVVPHVDEYAKPENERTTYTFNASIVTLPTKYPANYEELGYLDPAESIKTSDPGEWQSEVAIALKPESHEPTPPPPTSSTSTSTHSTSTSTHSTSTSTHSTSTSTHSTSTSTHSTSTSTHSKSTSTSSTSRSSVKTGDNTDLLPFYIAMGVSGALLVALGAYSLRKRREEQGK